jgi:hypothetical protein
VEVAETDGGMKTKRSRRAELCVHIAAWGIAILIVWIAVYFQ